MEDYIRKKKKTVEERLNELENRVLELEKENALMMRALAQLAENKAEEKGILIPGVDPENSPS
jgi:hypothetical protein